jgi:hypothetical protein
MSNIELCHLGDDCVPGIIIDDILDKHKKCLFMLGVFKFNDILFYLNDNNFENIYNKDYLINEYDLWIKHSLYNFIFNHDYKIENGEITNYDFIKNRFDTKISNFREMLSSDNTCVFISFTENINEIEIGGMLYWLTLHKKNFHLMIFTNNTYNSNFSPEHLSIIKLDISYKDWYSREESYKYLLYKEIYEKFIHHLHISNIVHDFPKTFHETGY